MITIPMKIETPLNRNSLDTLNKPMAAGVLTARTIETLNKQSIWNNKQMSANQTAAGSSQPGKSPQPSTQHNISGSSITSIPPQMKIPTLIHPVQKGQKTPLSAGQSLHSVRACFGWNTANPQCDVDVSAFLLDSSGKVPGDSWFVFYGQTLSPDNSTQFHVSNTTDREIITIDFNKLNPEVKKIVFVLTINEAFEKKLHFGMMKDAYIRILDQRQTELVSFKMTDYYSNVISMMIGELYEHSGIWKFNAVGNGVAKDLAGLCALYGVQTSDP